MTVVLGSLAVFGVGAVLVPAATVAVTATRDIPYAYCVYDHARKEALSQIRIWLRSVGIEPAGRYGLWTYFWSDEAIMSARKVAERVMGREQACAAQAG